MILILSNRYDQTTIDIIKWLEHYNANWLKISLDQVFFLQRKMDISVREDGNLSFKINLNNREIDLIRDTNVVLYRRWGAIDVESTWNLKEKLPIQVNKFLNDEYNAIVLTLIKALNKKKWISHPNTSSVNKIKVLELAKNLDLNIPDFIISNNFEQINLFYNKNNTKIILKPVFETGDFNIDDEYYPQYNILLSENLLKNMKKKNYLFPLLFQEYIEKDFEIRTFILEDKLYSIAIFSQQNNRTIVDYRNYSPTDSNRNVAYKLPKMIESKLLKLMKLLNLDTGSVDIIKSKDNKYYFLEVNPVGQFGELSRVGNYYIEREIASLLLKYKKN